MSILSLLFPVLCFANLALVVVAIFRPDFNSDEPLAAKRPDFAGIVAVTMVSLSQLLYLSLILAGLLHWIRFYPGNPIQTYSLLAGIFLSLIAFFVGFAASGLRRLAAIVVAVTTAFLWLLFAITSSAV